MAKAVITIGGTQHLVGEGDEITVNKIDTKDKKLTVPANMLVDGKGSKVGNPEVKGATVTLDIVEQDKKAEKVTAIRYKAKKRVHKVRGHRQLQTVLKVASIK